MIKITLLGCFFALVLAKQDHDEIRVGGYAKEFDWREVAAVTPVQDQG
jgi:hypothetical protein